MRFFLLLSLASLASQASADITPAVQSRPMSAAAIETTRLASPLAREQLVAALARDLAAHFNLEGDLQLELVRPWTPPARVAGIWNVSIVEYPIVPSASMLVRCRVLADAVAVADVSLVLKASHWRDVWVSRLPLAAGAGFDPTQLEARRVDLFRERDVVPATVGDRSYLYARSVAAGRVLTWRDIARRPLVKKGNMVEVSAADGFLLVTMKALAMENGAQGDTVTVRNPESHKNFAAIVVDENRVQVRF
jgi:flagella basal body P-ring formation protein FlgA